MDQCYLKLFGTCWMCDCKAMQEGKITKEEFKSREDKAIELKYHGQNN